MASSPSIVCPSNHTYRFMIHRWLIFGCALCFSPFSRLSSCSTSSQGHSWSHRSFRRPRKSEHILRQEIAGVGRFSAPLISPSDQWGMWTALMATAAFGIWFSSVYAHFYWTSTIKKSEKTRVGSAISGAMVSILVGLVASSAGVIAADSPVYRVVMEFLLPLAVPLLLFNADLRRVMRSTGTLLLAFLIGSFATTVGTVVAYLIMPMRSLGQDSWKIAAALMSRHIGGAVNYVTVSEALGVSPSVLTAGLAADNGHIIPKERDKLSDDPKERRKLPVLQSAIAISISFAICKLATYVTKVFGIQGGNLPCITAIIVILATVFPRQFGSLAPAGEAIASILMQVFFAVVVANGSLWNVINTTPGIFAFSSIQILVHVAVILVLGKLFGFEKKVLLIASTANVGGPTTACGMATAKGWNSLIIPGILAGVFGIAIATFIGIIFVLKCMQLLSQIR